MEIRSLFFRSNRLSKIFIVAAFYFVLGKLGLLLAIPPGVATPLWPSSGIALAAVLIWGYQVWPGIWLGSLLVNIGTLLDSTSTLPAIVPLAVAGGIATGSTLQAILGAFLIRRVIGSIHPFDKVKNVTTFVGLMFASCLTASMIGTTTLVFGGNIPWSAYPVTWVTWWLGDLISVLIIVPLALHWEKEVWSQWDRQRLMEGVFLLVLLFIVDQIALGGKYVFRFFINPSAYLTIPFILWAAFRFGQVGVMASILVVLGTAIFGIFHGVGPFVQETVNESFLALQIYIGIITVTGLVLAAALAERKHIERYLTIQYRVARILTQSATLQEAVREIFQVICEELGWHYGGLWKVDQEAGVLRCVTIWYVSSVRFPEFEDLSRRTTFSSGVGLPGRVLSSGNPVWIMDVRKDPNFPRVPMAIKEGLRAACAFPILRDGNVLGVIEFFSVYQRRPDEDAIQLLASVGDKISRFMEYRRTSDIVQESEIRNRAIIESALDCIITMDHEGKIIEFNPAAEKTFGYSRAESIGKPLAKLIIPHRLRNDHLMGLQNYLATGKGSLLNKRIEMTALRSDETEFPVEVAISQVPIAGNPIFTGFLRDISERKQAEDTIRKLSTPVLQIRPGLLILPVIGTMDKQRVDQLREKLLSGIRSYRAKVAVMDITGIAFTEVDSVKQIMSMVEAARLMGAQVILTGMGKPFSEALLSANIKLDMMVSVGDLQRGMEVAERMVEEMSRPVRIAD